MYVRLVLQSIQQLQFQYCDAILELTRGTLENLNMRQIVAELSFFIQALKVAQFQIQFLLAILIGLFGVISMAQKAER
jgi:hypothetical protein